MPADTKRTSVVLSALQVTRRCLADIPESPEVDGLMRSIADCEREALGWRSASPTSQERETVMKRALAIHVAVAKLGRERGTSP